MLIASLLIGSIAASIQAGIGNVVAGGWFATATSAAMGGYGVPVVAAIGQGIGVGAAFVGGAFAAKELRKEKEGEEARGGQGEDGDVPPNDSKNDGKEDGAGTEKEKASCWRQSGLGRRDFDDESTLLDDGSDSEDDDKDWLP